MTGAFTIVSPEKCQHYARFMQRTGRDQADAIFWTLFMFTVILLIIASSMHTKASRTLVDLERSPPDARHHTQVRMKCLLVSLVCFLLAFVAVIMEAFAAFSIQFCDGEDLMMLYWGFWTLVQVGSLIAIFGIMLNQWYSLREKEHPPWNVALGTPVLVIAALGHAWQSCFKTAWRKWRGSPKKKKKKRRVSEADGVELRRIATTPPHPNARLIGYSLINEPLYKVGLQDITCTPQSRMIQLSDVGLVIGIEMEAKRWESVKGSQGSAASHSNEV